MATKNRIGLLLEPADQLRQLLELASQPEPRGRRRKWDNWQLGALIVEVERMVGPSSPGRSVSWACQTMANREPWRSFLEQLKTEPGLRRDALRRAYYRACKKRKVIWQARLMADYVRDCEEVGRLEDWDEGHLLAIVSRG